MKRPTRPSKSPRTNQRRGIDGDSGEGAVGASETSDWNLA
jgi:hypothetical protein